MLSSAKLVVFVATLVLPGMLAQTSRPAPASGVVRTGVTAPLPSLDSLRFLEGTWVAGSRDGRTALGTYTFARELNGHVLARKSTADESCDKATQPACARQDLFYVFQDAPGSPLQAINFDSDGHVLHYTVDQSTQASTSTLGKRDLVIFNSNTAQPGPRFRLRYEHDVDTQTGKEALSGAFEMMLPDGVWRTLQDWYGVRR